MNDLAKIKNKSTSELKMDLEALESKIERIKNISRKEERALSIPEASWIEDAENCIADIVNELGTRVEPAQTIQNRHLLGRGIGSPITSNNGPFNKFGDFLQAVKSAGTPGGRVDNRLYDIHNAATGLNETVPSDGSFLVQTDFTNELLREAVATGQLAKKCMKFELTGNSNGIKINAFDETSRASSRFGGVISYWADEASEYQASKPKFRQMELSLKKLTGLCYCTDEMLEDSSVLEAVLRMAFASEFGFQLDDVILNGTGAGQPLGVMNSGSLVSVSKETGQAASTIVGENIIKMVERTLGPSTNYAWLHSKTCLSQIYSLSLAVGTGGVPLFIAGGSIPNQPENRLLGLPLIECEQCQTLGTSGDLILADLPHGYALAEKGGIKTAVSLHVRFVYGEQVFRWTLRIDGQPTRASALTPAHGGSSYTQSHFVALETRD